MAKFQEKGAGFEQRPIIAAGEHILTLKETKVYDKKIAEQYRKRDKDGNIIGPETRQALLWIFESNKSDDEGNPYQYVVSTGLAYGDPKAKLTPFLDMLIPGITYEEAVNLDSDELAGRKWKVMIQHKPDENDKKKFWPNHLYFIPVEVKGAGKNKQSEPLTDDNNPFLSEE